MREPVGELNIHLCLSPARLGTGEMVQYDGFGGGGGCWVQVCADEERWSIRMLRKMFSFYSR